MTTVSIVMPAYNQAAYIADAISSALSQTWTDFELVVVNDGSTDDTGAIVSRFEDRRVRHINQSNQGLAAARNAGVELATGTYLAFLDADDAWLPTFIERCLLEIRQDMRLAGVYTDFLHIDQHGNSIPKNGAGLRAGPDLYTRLLEGGFFPPCAVMVRSDIVRKVGKFDEHLHGHGTEDWDLWLRITRASPIRGIKEPLAKYRMYSGSMSTNIAGMHACRMSVLVKHFGPPEGDPQTWSVDKRRANAFAHRNVAFAYLRQQQPEEAWNSLNNAFRIWPDLMGRLDTFYEIVCGYEPRGPHGQPESLHLARAGAEILKRLDVLFTEDVRPLEANRGAAYGNFYLALAMLSDQAGNWSAARGYLLRAIRYFPRLLRDGLVIRRLLKLFFGQKTIAGVRRLSSWFAGNETV